MTPPIAPPTAAAMTGVLCVVAGLVAPVGLGVDGVEEEETYEVVGLENSLQNARASPAGGTDDEDERLLGGGHECER